MEKKIILRNSSAQENLYNFKKNAYNNQLEDTQNMETFVNCLYKSEN